MYKIEKLTVKNRCEIPVNSVVEIEVAEKGLKDVINSVDGGDD